MRALFLFLLLANVALFAWFHYLSPPRAATDPAPLTRQIDPEKLRVIAPSALPPATAAAPKPAPAPAAGPVALECMEWGSFTLAGTERAEKALEPLALGPRLAHRRTEETASWWVFIPPQPNRQGAQKKAAELKELGVEEYFIVHEEGPQRWALSLGVFRSEEAAQARLTALRGQGVRSARIGLRETTVPKVWLQVSSVDPALERRLIDIALQTEGSELRPCP